MNDDKFVIIASNANAFKVIIRVLLLKFKVSCHVLKALSLIFSLTRKTCIYFTHKIPIGCVLKSIINNFHMLNHQLPPNRDQMFCLVIILPGQRFSHFGQFLVRSAVSRSSYKSQHFSHTHTLLDV